MKKALSIILALIMALATALPAFAADNEIKLGEPTTIEVKADGETEITFIPEKDGIYTVYSGGRYDELSSNAFNFYSYSHSIIDEEGRYEGDKGIFIGEKGKPCTMTFFGEESDYSLNIEINEFSCGSLTDGTNSVKLGGRSYFTFVPENDGYYNFASSCKEDVYFEIIDTDELWEENDNNGYKDDYNFDCTVSLKAGKTYLVELGFYSNNYDMIDCDVIITYGKTEKAEDFNIYSTFYRCGNKWLMPKNSAEFLYYIDLIPSGSAPTADVKIVSGDESIITVEKDEDFIAYTVYSGNKAGNAVIKVTADDVTKDIKIKVCNDFEWFFVSLWYTFNSFLARVFHFRFA